MKLIILLFHFQSLSKSFFQKRKPTISMPSSDFMLALAVITDNLLNVYQTLRIWSGHCFDPLSHKYS